MTSQNDSASSGELVYEVDEDDRVIGKIPRSDAHARATYHRAVHALLREPGGRLILQKRSQSKAINPGRWTSTASGHVRFGASYLDSALEEVQEETGLTSVRLQEVGKLLLVAPGAKSRDICRAWTMLYTGDSPVHAAQLHPEEGEVTSFVAFSLADILAALTGQQKLQDPAGEPVLFANTLKHVIEAYVAAGGV